MADNFVKDGITYCGVCRRPKQTRIDLFGEIRLVNSMCACESEADDKKRKSFAEEQRMIYINDLKVNSIKDRERRKCRFENAEMTDNLMKCKRYADNWNEIKRKNEGLVLWGKCGNGKSFAAACIANELWSRNIPTLMTSFPSILSDKNAAQDIARQMQEYELVILDDLGAERQSEYAQEIVFYIIDERYKSGKPLIVTTNLSYETMKNYRNGKDEFGSSMNDNMTYARIYDRILEMCVPLKFDDDTRRIKPLYDKAKDLRNIFGGRANAATR